MSVFYDINKQANDIPGSDKDIMPFLDLFLALSPEKQEEYRRGSDLYEELSDGAPVWPPYIAKYDEQINAILAAS